MALEQAKKFLEELRTNDKVKELLQGKEAPKSVEEAVNTYLGVAKELGFDLSAEDLLSAIREAAKGQAEQTADAETAVQSLGMDDLAMATGGGCTDALETVVDAGKKEGKKILDNVCQAIFW